MSEMDGPADLDSVAIGRDTRPRVYQENKGERVNELANQSHQGMVVERERVHDLRKSIRGDVIIVLSG
jgi:hypothetical protein